jgi:hypothetical protein
MENTEKNNDWGKSDYLTGYKIQMGDVIYSMKRAIQNHHRNYKILPFCIPFTNLLK